MAAEVSLELDYRQLNGKTKKVERKSRKSFSSLSTKCCFFCSGLLLGLLLSLLLLSSFQYVTQNPRQGRALNHKTTIFTTNYPEITSTLLTTQLAEQLTTESFVTTLSPIKQQTIKETTPMTPVNHVINVSETEHVTTQLTTEMTTQTAIGLTTEFNNQLTKSVVNETPIVVIENDLTSPQLITPLDTTSPELTTTTNLDTTTTTTVVMNESVNSLDTTTVVNEGTVVIETPITTVMNDMTTNTTVNSLDITTESDFNNITEESSNITDLMTRDNNTEISYNTTQESSNNTSFVNNSVLIDFSDNSLVNNTFSHELNQTLIQLNQTESCLSNQFVCPNQTNCLSRDLLCDGRVDCLPDGWDESQCEDNCLENFKCNSSQCISQKNYCDGIWDCPMGSDELGCHVSICQKGHFLCKDQSKCILGKHACDQVSHCPDHSDEIGCVNSEKCSSSGRFFCLEDGLCIDRALKCDSINDCLKGSDELNCDTQSTCSEKNGFLCQNNECISREKRCNGINDCLDFSDEFQCLSLEKSSKIVFFFNSQQNTWSPLCVSSHEFNSSLADLLCQQMGEWKSKNYSFINLIPKQGFWAINQTFFSNKCSTNQSISLECLQQQCGQNSQNNSDSAPSGLIIRDNNGSQCWSHVIASHWLILSAGCLKNLSSNVTQLEILSHKKELIDVKIDYLLSHFRYSNFRSLRVPDFDVSLVRTRTLLPPSPTCLPSHAIDPAITCFVENNLEEIAFEVIESKVCNGSNHLAGSLTSRHFCGKTSLKRCLSEGEPLMCLSSSSLWYISGFISFQYGCNQFPGYSYVSHPVVFSNVFSVYEWIIKSIGKQEISFETILYEIPEISEKNLTSGEIIKVYSNETKEEEERETSPETTSMPFN